MLQFVNYCTIVENESCPSLHVLKYKVECVVLSDHLLQLYYIGVRELLEAFNLAKIHSLFPSVIFSLHPFDGNLNRSSQMWLIVEKKGDYEVDFSQILKTYGVKQIN